MIIVRLKGGLGNQMFQYAAARQLSAKLAVPLKLDTAFLQRDTADRTRRDFELDKFNIQTQIASAKEVEKLREKNWTRLFRPNQVKERLFSCRKPFLKEGNSYYMNGYWQSEKYFKDIADIIRNEFVFKAPLNDSYFVQIQRQIDSTNSVSLHFRRGDYVSDKKTSEYHGVCPLEYYERAVEKLSEQLLFPHLFVFSDDISWVKSHFRTRFPTVYVEKSDEALHSDFRLMSRCKHNVIANSSYSWWAAWLNSNEEKTVIAPQQWYKNKRKQLLATDKVPKQWLKI